MEALAYWVTKQNKNTGYNYMITSDLATEVSQQGWRVTAGRFTCENFLAADLMTLYVDETDGIACQKSERPTTAGVTVNLTPLVRLKEQLILLLDTPRNGWGKVLASSGWSALMAVQSSLVVRHHHLHLQVRRSKEPGRYNKDCV